METTYQVIVILVLVSFGQCEDLCSGPSLELEGFTCGEGPVDQSKIENKPKVVFKMAEKPSKYLLIMYDPDVMKGPDKKKYYVHWMQSNIKGENLRTGNIDGVENMAYQSPHPPKPQTHRYVFRLYKQTIEGPLRKLPESRMPFYLDEFVNANNLEPVAQFYYKYKQPA